MAGVTSVVIDGTTYLVDDINAVDFSEDQGLSEQQQEQGRSNIGAASTASLADKADKADLDALAGTVGDLSDDVDGFTEALADKASAIVDTASGAIASFPDGAAAPAKDVTIGIEPVQSGSGDPSPENVRPISGWTGANVVVSPTTAAQDGTTYPISWQSEAGTVYGGALYVTSGVLTVKWAKKEITSTSQIGDVYADSTNGSYCVVTDISGAIVDAANIHVISNKCKSVTGNDRLIDKEIDRCYTDVYGSVILRASNEVSISTKQQMIDHFANSIEFVYELASPTVIQLDPVTVTTLLGQNNVWADTGDSTVAYRADTKLYIQKINAPTDDDMIADAQIASGKYFIVGGNLYKSTTTIPAGDTITPGTNCILTNLADALNALNT